MPIWAKVIVIILVVILVLLVILYFVSGKLERKQLAQKDQMEAMAQTINIIPIDKKRLRLDQSGLPKAVIDQSPKYLRWTKIPIVKAKVGPKIMTLIADKQVFDTIPLKIDCRVVVSGIYISAIKSVRGGNVEKPKVKQGFFKKLLNK